MRQNAYLDENQIRKTISILKPDNQLFEARILASNKRNNMSGYFRDADTLIRAFDNVDVRDKNVYITLNRIDDSLYSRAQHDSFKQTSEATHDAEVIGYDWLFIDLDPVRVSGVSSSNSEFRAANELAVKVYRYLKELGFTEPVKAISGNGFHLLYNIHLKNTDENRSLIERCLKALSEMFSNDEVKIDTVNGNPSRICKLHGTLAQKGANTADRPHRMSYIFSAPETIQRNDIVFLQKLASQLPEESASPAPVSYKDSEFDLLQFMADNGLTYSKTISAKDSIAYCLDMCPFDNSHVDGDAKIFHYSNGAISFKCHHNSCSEYKWQDVRKKFDPTCYNKPTYNDIDAQIDAGWREHNRYKAAESLSYETPVPQSVDDLFRTAEQIASDPEPDIEYIKTGITVIDNKLHGIPKGGISVLSGLRASGKSTVLGQIMLNAIEMRHTVICYSGELANKKYLKWLELQAAGHNNVEVSLKYQNGYDVPEGKKKAIHEWMGNYFYLYNNKYGNQFEKIASYLKAAITSKKADLCVVDNLMALDLSSMGYDQNSQQTNFVWRLKQIAEETNCHIMFVAHPKKTMGFLRLNDISGSGNISNIVDDAFIIHRVNNDFVRLSKEMFHWNENDAIYSANNVIEIAKDRETGVQDEFIKLYFEQESKRLLNSKDEHIQYSWENGFHQVEDWEIPF